MTESIQWQLSPLLRLTLWSGTVQIPACDRFPALSLTDQELKYLYLLATDTSWLTSANDDAQSLVNELGRRELLSNHDSGDIHLPANHDTAVPYNPAPLPETALRTRLPLVFSVSSEGFLVHGHDGTTLARLSSEDLVLLSVFTTAWSMDEAWQSVTTRLPQDSITRQAFIHRVTEMHAAGLIESASRALSRLQFAQQQEKHLRESIQRIGNAVEAEVDAYHTTGEAAGDNSRIRIIPAVRQPTLPPLAIGMLFALTRKHENGALLQHYQPVPDWVLPEHRLREYLDHPAIYLFSNYVWNHKPNLALSRRIKETSPGSVTLHGGADSPKNPVDVQRYFQDNPHIDIVVHGEGERTFCDVLTALVGHVQPSGADLSVLRDVPGISFRDIDGRIVRTANRERISNLDELPSPYLQGEFSAYEDQSTVTAVIETNRGCPYACTFCDWGSATQSKVRKFALQRVYDELEWCARNRVRHIFLADANFGMLARDVDIARKVVELKNTYGYPRVFSTNYAKNQVQYLREIVQILVDAGIVTEGLLSLQTLDQSTLEAIHRSNIKTEKYDELAREFRSAGLPLFVDLMMGLPGATVASFRDDLQHCIDREVTAKIFQTEMLVNSPMNDPGYRQLHGIETDTVSGGFSMSSARNSNMNGGRAIVVSSNTFSREDYDYMLSLRSAFRLFENYGILRHVARQLRQSAGIHEMVFYETLLKSCNGGPDVSHQWPVITFVLRSMPEVMAPPGSWHWFIREIGDFIIQHWPQAEGTALNTALRVQHALLPSPDRTFPVTVALPHDYAQWHSAMMTEKDAGNIHHWESAIPALDTYPPGELCVDDPNHVCSQGLGFFNGDDFYGDWELASSVSRPMLGKTVQLMFTEQAPSLAPVVMSTSTPPVLHP